MKMVEQQAAFLLDVCALIRYATDLGFVVTGGELYRTAEQQKIYVQTGRSKTFNSYHLKRLAIDLNFFEAGKLIYDKHKLQVVGDYWTSLNKNNQWGGNWKSFKDVPHFERRV